MWKDATITVACHRCGKPQERHYSRARQPATCFECRAVRQKEWSRSRAERATATTLERADSDPPALSAAPVKN
jgi:hypothetical protein